MDMFFFFGQQLFMDMLTKVFQVYKLRKTLKMLVLQRIDDSDFDSASSKRYIDSVKDEKLR